MWRRLTLIICEFWVSCELEKVSQHWISLSCFEPLILWELKKSVLSPGAVCSLKHQHLNSETLNTGGGCDNCKTNFATLTTLYLFSKGYFFLKRPAIHCKIGWFYHFVHSCKCSAVQSDGWSQVGWLHKACGAGVCSARLAGAAQMTDNHVRTASVSVTFSPPDHGRARSAAGHPCEPVVPVPCGCRQCARDQGLHSTQQALPFLQRWVCPHLVCCSPSSHSHLEHSLICLLLWQQVFNRWIFVAVVLGEAKEYCNTEFFQRQKKGNLLKKKSHFYRLDHRTRIESSLFVQGR